MHGYVQIRHAWKAVRIASVMICFLIPAVAQAQPVKIYEIQGEGHVSPFVGQEVTTTGIVTAVAFDGYYVQDPEGDMSRWLNRIQPKSFYSPGSTGPHRCSWSCGRQ